MRLTLLWLLATMALFGLAGCSPDETPLQESATGEDAVASSSDPLSGKWVGDWGPSLQDRNDVTLELKWDGTHLSGTVNPGATPVALTKASFDSAAGIVMMEAETDARGSKMHYTIEGKVEGNMMSGSWSHENRKGDFKLTRN